MKQAHRTLLAFLAASIVPALFLAVAYPLSGAHDWLSVLGTFVVAYYFSAAATGLLGFPAFLVLRKFKLVTWWSAVVGGALVGAVVSTVMTSGRVSDMQGLSTFTILGVFAGLAFWLVWRPRSRTATSGDSRQT